MANRRVRFNWMIAREPTPKERRDQKRLLSPMRGTDLLPRRFPYPYRAMLAICSDLDETPDARSYFESMRFLNTLDSTSVGRGVGLEVGNSIYFDMPPEQFSYWNTDDAGREMVRSLIRSGHVDCLHSYGDLAITRAHAARALEELNHHGLSLKVWVDHAIAPTNIGADIMRGHGDEVGHPAYHADLTLAAGIRYIWLGRVTSIVGQDRSASLGHWNENFICGSSVRARAKEAGKHVLAQLGSTKYALHAGNRLCRPAELRDGSSATEFMRCNPHPAGVEFGESGHSIGQVLTTGFLNRLVERNSCSIVYTHLGKLQGSRKFSQDAVHGFRVLAEYVHRGDILVTTTLRLLEFHAAAQNAAFSASRCGSSVKVEIALPAFTVPDGLTFYVEPAEAISATVNGKQTNVAINPPDETGRRSVSIRWPALSFPEL